MSKEIEIEFKNMLTEQEFQHLIEAFSIKEEQFIKQENYYFETKNFDLKNHQSALRIRKKQNTYTLTLKQPHKKGKLETHQVLTQTEADQMMQQKLFIDGEVKDAIIRMGINPDMLEYFGTLMTNRAEIEYKNGVLVFDNSEYLNINDYELEYEVQDEKTGKEIFLTLLKTYDIPQRKTENKIKRFFKEKQRQLHNHS